MDIFVDPDGVVIVRNCGCGRHGPNSLWTDHGEDWKIANRKEAGRRTAEHRARQNLRGDAARFDRADAVVRGEKF